MFHTLLFDLDGTLIDSVDLIVRSYRYASEHHLGIVTSDDVWIERLGTPMHNQLRAVSDDDSIIAAMAVTYGEYYRKHHDSEVTLFKGVHDVISALYDKGNTLGVVTSKLRAGTNRSLELVKLKPFFDVIVTADQVSRPKPDPEPVQLALERLDAAPTEVVFIGDSPHDIASGREAGVATAAVLWGPFSISALEAARPDYFLTEPAEIVSVLSG